MSIFFGAGAEVSYGLPTGGKFALDIFRIPNDEDRESFRKQIQAIDPRSQIATQWLPDNYAKKRLNVFGKGEFESLIASSLENKKNNINDYLENFDKNIIIILKEWTINELKLDEVFFNLTNENIGDSTYGQSIKLNEKLAKDVKLFDSVYFSAFLRLLEINPNDRDLKRIIRAFLELLIGAKGQNLVAQLNEDLFEAAPDKLSIFDDFSGIFSLNYKDVGQTGLEIVIEDKPSEIQLDSDGTDIFKELGRLILEDIYSHSIDYQSLIDSHFRYLYNPKSHWAKFSRISIFLHTVHRYINESFELDDEKIKKGYGYYHDLIEMSEHFKLQCIGTTNYNSFIKDILHESTLENINTYHLNGSVNDYYDPYKNEILSNPNDNEKKNKILVPFMFTQSGVKPLTTVEMSRKYVELYDEFKASDYICIIGYAFNGDDGHINGLFRNLIENHHKNIIIIHYATDDSSPSQLKRHYQLLLRLDHYRNIKVIKVDHNRMSDNTVWYDVVKQETQEEYS